MSSTKKSKLEQSVPEEKSDPVKPETPNCAGSDFVAVWPDFLDDGSTIVVETVGGNKINIDQAKFSSSPNMPDVRRSSNDTAEIWGGARSPAAFLEHIVVTDIFSPDNTRDLAKLLECPICMEIVTVPVLCCARGHIVCNNCRTKSERCPLCQGTYAQIHNYLADELVKKCFAKCKYHSIGCGLRLLESEKISHEQDCDFRPFECNLVGELHTCRKSLIRYDKFKHHIMHGHQLKGACTDYGEWFETATPDELKLMTDHVNEFAYLEYFDKLFLCASAIYEGQMMWWIYLVGSKAEAIMFEGEINITHLEKNMSLSWQGPIHSIRTSSREVFNSGLGLAVSARNLRPLTTFLPKTKKYEWVVGFHVVKKSSNNVNNIF